MKRKIRRQVFETNSSSVHSIQICSKNDFERWKAGELLWNPWGEAFIEVPEGVNPEEYSREMDSVTFTRFFDSESYLEHFAKEYTTEEHEDEIVCFGYYGYDG